MYILNLKYFIAKKCYPLSELSVSHDLFAVGTSKITDHYSKYNNNEKFDIFWKNLIYCQNYQNVTQRHEVSKYCWKNGTSRLA